ncbi:hypothetical protein B5S32_g2041 [[Candida] boidinii]|nr:hypothetical protein B5S32_g2041 [[Candida] boidinii]
MSAMYESALWFDDDHDQTPSNNYSNKKNSKLGKLFRSKNSKVLRYFDLDDTPRSFKPFSIIGSGNNSASNTNFSNNHNNSGNIHDSTITPTSVSTPYGMKHVAHVDHLSCFGLEHCLQTNDVLLLPRVLKSLEKPQPEFVTSSTAEFNNYNNNDKTNNNNNKTIRRSKSFANIRINTDVSANLLSSPISTSFPSPVTNEPRKTSVDIDSVSTPKSNTTFSMDNDAVHQTPATTISSDSLTSTGTIVTSTGTEIAPSTPNVPFKAFAYSRTPTASTRRSVDFVSIPNGQTETSSSSPVRSNSSASSRRASHSTIKGNEKQHQVLTLTSVNKKFNVVSYAHTPASHTNSADNLASTIDEDESSNVIKEDSSSSSTSLSPSHSTKGRSFRLSTDKLSKSQSFHILPLPSVSFKDSSIVKSKSMNNISIPSPKRKSSNRMPNSQSFGQSQTASNNFIRIPESPSRQTQIFTSSPRSSLNISNNNGNNNNRSYNSIDSQTSPQPPNFSSSIPPSIPSRETLPFIHTASFNSRIIVEETVIENSETKKEPEDRISNEAKNVDISQGSPSLKDFDDAESKLSTPFTETADSSSTESIVDHKEQDDPFLGHQIKQKTHNSHSQSKEKHQKQYQTGNHVSNVEYLNSDDIDNYEMMGTAEAIYQTHYSPTKPTYQHNSIAEVSDESSVCSDEGDDEMEVIKKNGSFYNLNSKKVLSSSNWQKLEDGFNQVSELLSLDKSTN